MDQNQNSNNNTNSQSQTKINSQTQLSEKEIKKQETHEASQKTAHVAGKGLATYYGGAVGGKLYDAASKTKLGKGIESTVGKAAETSPMAKPLFRALNKSGALDVADKAIDAAGTKGGSASSNGFKNLNTSQNVTNNVSSLKSISNTQYNNQKKLENKKLNADVTTYNKFNDFQNLINSGIDAKQNQKINEINNSIDEDESLVHELARKKLEKEKAKAKAKVQKKIIQFLINNPASVAAIIAIALVLVLFLIVVIFVVMDVDFVGTGISNYSEADTMQNKCNSITLVLEDSRFTGDAVASIEDVDLSETFTLSNGTTANRWSSKTYLLDEYVKGVINAEAREVNDETTFEVASIVARTYALTITSSQCYTFSNENTRYSNPQQFAELTSSSSNYAEIKTAVDSTIGTVITKDGNLYDHSNSSYYDYFCFKEKTRDGEGEYYRMLQENREERLQIHETWKQDNVRDGLENTNCQQEGMSLFGAKYLLTKEVHEYTTFRVLKYYYGYDIEFKRVSETTLSNGCYYWPIGSDETTNEGGVNMATGSPATVTITSPFGYRSSPTAGASNNHMAIDIGGGVGGQTNIISAEDGTVIAVNSGCVAGNSTCGGRLGNYVKIQHSDGNITRYGHMYSVSVVNGQTLKKGQVIGKMGTTGTSTGNHLDFQIIVNGDKVDPLNYVSPTNPRPENCGMNVGNGAVVSTGENKKTICKTLLNNGFNPSGVAGIMMNLYSESKYDPNAFNSRGGGIGAYGIAQWRADRQRKLKALANYQTVEVKIMYLINEISTGTEQSAGNVYISAMNTGSDVATLTKIWCEQYERPEAGECSARVSGNISTINELYNYAQNDCN